MQTNLNTHFWILFTLLVTGGMLAAGLLTLLFDTVIERLRHRRNRHSPPLARSGRPPDPDRRFATRLTTGHFGHGRHKAAVRR